MAGNDVSHKNERHMSTPELGWPKFWWRVAMWVAIVSLVLSLILFIFPNLSEGMSIRERLLLAGLILAGPFVVISAIPWLFKAAVVVVRRVQHCPTLFNLAEAKERDLTEARDIVKALVRAGIGISGFGIRKAAFFKGRLTISLRGDAGSELAVGDKIRVIDSRDGILMGVFEVTAITQDGCYAVDVSDLDPLWLGHVRGLGETEVTPDLVAIHV